MEMKLLRDLVAGRVDRRWSEWAQAHPNLAAVIDRTRLIESAVGRLRDDPRFVEAMRRAELDDARLAAAVRVVEEAEQVVGRLLGM